MSVTTDFALQFLPSSLAPPPTHGPFRSHFTGHKWSGYSPEASVRSQGSLCEPGGG